MLVNFGVVLLWIAGISAMTFAILGDRISFEMHTKAYPIVTKMWLAGLVTMLVGFIVKAV